MHWILFTALVKTIPNFLIQCILATCLDPDWEQSKAVHPPVRSSFKSLGFTFGICINPTLNHYRTETHLSDKWFYRSERPLICKVQQGQGGSGKRCNMQGSLTPLLLTTCQRWEATTTMHHGELIAWKEEVACGSLSG